MLKDIQNNILQISYGHLYLRALKNKEKYLITSEGQISLGWEGNVAGKGYKEVVF